MGRITEAKKREIVEIYKQIKDIKKTAKKAHVSGATASKYVNLYEQQLVATQKDRVNPYTSIATNHSSLSESGGDPKETVSEQFLPKLLGPLNGEIAAKIFEYLEKDVKPQQIVILEKLNPEAVMEYVLKYWELKGLHSLKKIYDEKGSDGVQQLVRIDANMISLGIEPTDMDYYRYAKDRTQLEQEKQQLTAEVLTLGVERDGLKKEVALLRDEKARIAKETTELEYLFDGLEEDIDKMEQRKKTLDEELQTAKRIVSMIKDEPEFRKIVSHFSTSATGHLPPKGVLIAEMIFVRTLAALHKDPERLQLLQAKSPHWEAVAELSNLDPHINTLAIITFVEVLDSVRRHLGQI
jgi:hypothetical protein